LLAARLDPFRLEQALANLLHNAIKYTPPGGAIEVVLSQPRPDQIKIEVRDNGPGIPPEARESVFDRFASVNASGPTRGLGLGLYLSRQIVQLHGGELDLESPPEGGTRFVVRMPTAISRKSASRQVGKSASRQVGKSASRQVGKSARTTESR
jgi:signal transduction histidine kinase